MPDIKVKKIELEDPQCCSWCGKDMKSKVGTMVWAMCETFKGGNIGHIYEWYCKRECAVEDGALLQ